MNRLFVEKESLQLLREEPVCRQQGGTIHSEANFSHRGAIRAADLLV